MKRKIIASFNLVGFIIVATIFSGCVKDLEKMALKSAFSSHASKYQPLLVSKNEFKQHKALLQSVDDKVVSDEKGSYYHKFLNNDSYRLKLNNQDQSILRKEFKKGKGLMTPFYRIAYQEKTVYVVIDKERTAKYYKYFTKTMKLSLKPLTDTYKYAKVGSKLRGAYDVKTVTNIINKMGIKVDYIIINGGFAEDYFNNANVGYSDFKSLRYSFKRLVASDTVSFQSLKKKQAETGGWVYLTTGCQGANYELVEKATNIKITKDNIDSLLNEALTINKRINANLLQQCNNGFKKFKISASVKSSKLK